nr:hypothetical protein [Rhizoctonia zeae hypovirus 2]
MGTRRLNGFQTQNEQVFAQLSYDDECNQVIRAIKKSKGKELSTGQASGATPEYRLRMTRAAELRKSQDATVRNFIGRTLPSVTDYVPYYFAKSPRASISGILVKAIGPAIQNSLSVVSPNSLRISAKEEKKNARLGPNAPQATYVEIGDRIRALEEQDVPLGGSRDRVALAEYMQDLQFVKQYPSQNLVFAPNILDVHESLELDVANCEVEHDSTRSLVAFRPTGANPLAAAMRKVIDHIFLWHWEGKKGQDLIEQAKWLESQLLTIADTRIVLPCITGLRLGVHVLLSLNEEGKLDTTPIGKPNPGHEFDLVFIEHLVDDVSIYEEYEKRTRSYLRESFLCTMTSVVPQAVLKHDPSATWHSRHSWWKRDDKPRPFSAEAFDFFSALVGRALAWTIHGRGQYVKNPDDGQVTKVGYYQDDVSLIVSLVESTPVAPGRPRRITHPVKFIRTGGVVGEASHSAPRPTQDKARHRQAEDWFDDAPELDFIQATPTRRQGKAGATRKGIRSIHRDQKYNRYYSS